MIQDAVSCLRGMIEKPWLILGKGPTLEMRDRFNLDSFYSIALNHACLVCPANVAHFTDIEAFETCQDGMLNKDSALVLPWYPHKNMVPHFETLDELVTRFPVMMDRYSKRMLMTYNSSRVPGVRHAKLWNTITVRYFSAVAAFNLLVKAGHRVIYTLGVDGGTKYAKDFDVKDCLANGQRTFDVQFEEIKRTCKRHKITHINLAGVGS